MKKLVLLFILLVGFLAEAQQPKVDKVRWTGISEASMNALIVPANEFWEVTLDTGIKYQWDGDSWEVTGFQPSSLLADYAFTDNSTNWNTAFGWGNWSTGVDETFIGGLDLGTIPKFGITGQILVKSSNFNYDVEWQDFSGGGNLISITEGVNTGWRLEGFNPTFYGDIGQDATDLSISDSSVSSVLGATGNYAFAANRNNEASGNASVAFGIANKASGALSFSIGNINESTGAYASTFGFGNFSKGWNGFLIGRHGLIDHDPTVIGQTDVAFAIGNGTGYLLENKKNSFEILQNGVAISKDATVAMIDASATGKELTTVEWINAQSFSTGGAISAPLNEVVFGSDTGVQSSPRLKFFSDFVATLHIGDNDGSENGSISLFGDNSTNGGFINLYNSASNDGIVNHWQIGSQNNFRINDVSPTAKTVFEIDASTGTLLALATTNANIDALGAKAVITKEYLDANSGSDLLAKSSTITTSRNALLTDADGLNVSTSASDVIITILNGTFEVGTVLAYQSNGAGQIFVDDSSGNIGQTFDARRLIRVWQTATDVWELYDPPVDVSDSIEGVSSLGTTYSDLVLSLGGIGFLDPSITIDHTTNVISLFSPNPINQSFTDITGSLTADSIIKDGATSDDVLLGDGTTTSLSGITAGTISNTWNDLTVDTTLDETTFNGDGFIHYYEAVNDSIAVTIPDDTTLGIASTDDVSYSFFRKGSGKIQTVFASGVEGENVEHVADSTKRVFNLIHKGSNNWIASGDFQYYTPAVATSSNLILNSTFDNATNLTLGSAWSVGSGVASYDDSAISPIEFALSENLQNGVTYDVAIDFTTGGTARINVEINGVTSGWTELQSYWNFSNGSTSFPLTMSEEATAIRFNGNTSHSTFTIDNVTITPQ